MPSKARETEKGLKRQCSHAGFKSLPALAKPKRKGKMMNIISVNKLIAILEDLKEDGFKTLSLDEFLEILMAEFNIDSLDIIDALKKKGEQSSYLVVNALDLDSIKKRGGDTYDHQS